MINVSIFVSLNVACLRFCETAIAIEGIKGKWTKKKKYGSTKMKTIPKQQEKELLPNWTQQLEKCMIKKAVLIMGRSTVPVAFRRRHINCRCTPR
uniref:Putative secreted protein n=1 Tax=Anopheles darlingi TaxID=43151 RepID=A0A2M4DHD4_ANODA